MKLRAAAGFTLAELLVATMLLSVVMTAVYTLFHSAVGSWRAVDKEFDVYQESRSAVSLIRREYENLVPGAGILFEGDDDEFTMYIVSEAMNVEESEGPRLIRARYYLQRTGRKRSLMREEAMVEATLPAFIPKEGLDPARIDKSLRDKGKFVVAENVHDFRVTYIWSPMPLFEDPLLPPKPVKHVFFDEHRLIWGLGYPQGIRIDLTIIDPSDRRRPHTVTTVIPTRAANQRWTLERLNEVLSG